MARTGYTNIAPSPERDRLFRKIAAAQGMAAGVHKHRVEMIDQALRSYAERIQRRETMGYTNDEAEIIPARYLSAAQQEELRENYERFGADDYRENRLILADEDFDGPRPSDARVTQMLDTAMVHGKDGETRNFIAGAYTAGWKQAATDDK